MQVKPRRGCRHLAVVVKTVWDPILVGVGEFATHFRLPILVGIGMIWMLTHGHLGDYSSPAHVV